MSERKFTQEELKQFDGKEGRPAYFAVDGVVYDASASKLWRNGTHVRVHNAGAELSGAILVAPHPKDRLDGLPKVGVLADPPPPPPVTKDDEVPWFARLSYKMHGHPASENATHDRTRTVPYIQAYEASYVRYIPGPNQPESVALGAPSACVTRPLEQMPPSHF